MADSIERLEKQELLQIILLLPDLMSFSKISGTAEILQDLRTRSF